MLSTTFSPAAQTAAPLFSDPVALRIHEPDEPPPGAPQASQADWPDRLTLRVFFEMAVLPDLLEDGRARETISAYLTAIGHWEHRTVDPVLSEAAGFDSLGRFPVLDAWKAAMERDDFAAGTISKYWRCLRAMFRRAGPPTDRNPRGLGLIGRVPYMKPARGPVRKSRRFVGDEELVALYEACEAARPGRKGGSERPALLRLAIVGARTYGPRTRDLFALKRGPISMDPRHPIESRDGISFEPRHPDASQSLESPLGWFSYTVKKTGVRLILPISTAMRAHLEAVGVRGNDEGGPLFPSSFLKSNNVLYRAWDRLASAARERMLRERPDRKLAPEPACLQDLRKTANTLWKSLHPELNLGGFVLGHRNPGRENASSTNEQYYTERAVEVVRRFFLPPDATDLDRHFAWRELPQFLAQNRRERTLF